MSPLFTLPNGVACYLSDGEYFVYSGEHLARVCPSLGMAHEVAAGL
jgi:hypothetical protein